MINSLTASASYQQFLQNSAFNHHSTPSQASNRNVGFPFLLFPHLSQKSSELNVKEENENSIESTDSLEDLKQQKKMSYLDINLEKSLIYE